MFLVGMYWFTDNTDLIDQYFIVAILLQSLVQQMMLNNLKALYRVHSQVVHLYVPWLHTKK